MHSNRYFYAEIQCNNCFKSIVQKLFNLEVIFPDSILKKLKIWLFLYSACYLNWFNRKIVENISFYVRYELGNDY